MQSGTLRALEFDRIREALARETLTALGEARALRLEPSTDLDEVRSRLALAAEAAEFTRTRSLAIDAPDALREILGVLEVDEQILEPAALLGLARFLGSVEDVTSRIVGEAASGRFGRLTGIASRAASFAGEIGAIRQAIQSPGDVADTASPALREIRETLRRQRAKLRSGLDALAHGRETAKYLQDQIVTDRNGRYVLVVRAEHRENIPGIVHGSSASGASLYLEPLATVALNNDVVALVEREKEEVHRILLALTDAFRQRPEDLEATLDVAAEIDELQAGARLARRMDATAPELADDGRVELRGARHPLLIPAIRDLIDDEASGGPATVVSSDLLVLPPARALVISGPNTGGKTVALKAIGLLALMAQSGLLIPVEPGSRLTPFRSVFADIGDEQSIQASLSTFSARIANLVEMHRALVAPALVLLDEVGGGTDPVEGGALGTAVIDHFRKRGATVVATTHDDALKSYAATTEGVTTGAFGFNPDTYAPTYSLIYGAPGRSLALEIAERLGMPAAVVADARARRSGRESQLAAHLARVDTELAAVARSREALERDRQALEAERTRVLEKEARLAEREAILRKRSEDRLNEKLRDARAEVDRIVGQVKQRTDELAARAEQRATVSTGEVGQLRAGARTALEAVAQAHGAGSHAAPDAEPLPAPPVVGQVVFVPAFGAEARVTAVSGRRVEVDVRGKRMRVTADALRQPVRDARPRPSPGPGRAQRTGSARGTADTLVAPVRELVVVGATVDEAIDRVEKFLDAALLADEKRVRVVHGRGTGRLREGLREFLRANPLVNQVLPAGDDEGGDAVTIVELRD
jgi:DNA mismatch repair protein MutS2